MRVLLLVAGMAVVCLASEHRGQITFNALPVPGALIRASVGGRHVARVSDERGMYNFTGLSEGDWTIEVSMTGFATATQTVAVPGPPLEWVLAMLPLAEIQAQAATPPPSAQPEVRVAVPPKDKKSNENFSGLSADELAQRAADGFLINGAALNGAASPFGQLGAFGNNRRGARSLYNGSLGLILDHSSLDARSYSLTGQDTPRPDFSRMQGVVAFGGPLRWRPRIRNGPNVTLTYQWTRNRNVSTQSSLVPTLAQREGLFGNPVIDPLSGQPFVGNIVPASRISQQARVLQQLYPLPNFDNARYNFQSSLTGATHQDNFQSRFQQSLTRKNRLTGNAAWQSTRNDLPNLFSFVSHSQVSGVNAGLNWIHTFNPRLYSVLGVQFSRLGTQNTPYFSQRSNVSALAGITGNNQDPVNWGPPSLAFSGGIASLSDSIHARNSNQTTGSSLEVGWNQGRHNYAFGGSFRKLQFNILSQEDPRGSFAFTGAVTRDDYAGLLLGVPDTSSIAFGNADKYFRTKSVDLYARDDWRVGPSLTLNLGVRWEYSSPIEERQKRLVNLAVSPGYRTAAPVTGNGLIQPDRNNIAPRLAAAWRPLSASSLLVRAAYGIYFDTSIYQGIASQMAQQSPLSISLRVENSEANTLTLARGFTSSAATTRNTFGVDPHLRVGYSQNWLVSAQSDLPGGFITIVSYNGVKGLNAQQQFLPNTNPIGAINPCPSCPSGFTYLVSNGSSMRNSAQFELRRRLRSGFSSTFHYTLAKATDNAALGGRNQGGSLIAQNWLDLEAERGRSNFDQRHLVSWTTQYTTAMGRGAGMLMGGWRGALLKEWTMSTQMNTGSGLPLTPIYWRAVQGTGVTGSIRPDLTGVSIYDAAPGLHLNAAAFRAPVAGSWGDARRNSINGPAQFTLNGSMARTFRLKGDRWSLDARIDATNALNHPVFPSWNTTVTSTQFGLSNPANPMRSVQSTVRVRF